MGVRTALIITTSLTLALLLAMIDLFLGTIDLQGDHYTSLS
jgi:hypothetical protein